MILGSVPTSKTIEGCSIQFHGSITSFTHLLNFVLPKPFAKIGPCKSRIPVATHNIHFPSCKVRSVCKSIHIILLFLIWSNVMPESVAYHIKASYYLWIINLWVFYNDKATFYCLSFTPQSCSHEQTMMLPTSIFSKVLTGLNGKVFIVSTVFL